MQTPGQVLVNMQTVDSVGVGEPVERQCARVRMHEYILGGEMDEGLYR